MQLSVAQWRPGGYVGGGRTLVIGGTPRLDSPLNSDEPAQACLASVTNPLVGGGQEAPYSGTAGHPCGVWLGEATNVTGAVQRLALAWR